MLCMFFTSSLQAEIAGKVLPGCAVTDSITFVCLFLSIMLIVQGPRFKRNLQTSSNACLCMVDAQSVHMRNCHAFHSFEPFKQLRNPWFRPQENMTRSINALGEHALQSVNVIRNIYLSQTKSAANFSSWNIACLPCCSNIGADVRNYALQ